RLARRGRLRVDQRRVDAARRRAVRRLQAVGKRPRRVDRRIARMYADKKRQRHVEEECMKRWIVAALVAASSIANAEELAVGNYGVSANGMPFGVAMHKGYF